MTNEFLGHIARHLIRIAVVGGGLGGLATVYFLRKHYDASDDRIEIKLFEATDRVGGRVFTLRDFDEGLYAEAGAMSITDQESLMLSLVREMSLQATPRLDRRAKRCFLKGHFADCSPISEYMSLLSDRIQQLKAEGIIQKPCDWTTKNSTVLDDLDSMSIVEFFVQEGEDPDEARSVLGSSLIGFSTDKPDHTSVLDSLRFMSQYIGSQRIYSIQGGNDLLPQTLADFLDQERQTVFLKTPVTAVAQNENKWQVSFVTGKPERFDYVIIAVPLTAIQPQHAGSIQLPDLPPEQADALNKIGYCESVTRVYCEVNDRFWQKQPPYPSTAMTITDRRTLWIEDHTACQKGKHGILEAHACGQTGFDLGKSSDPNRVGEKLIASIYGKKFYKHLIAQKTSTVRWSEQSYQWGAYPYFQPGQRRLVAQLAKPWNGLFFVGEYACPDAPASMQGGVLSASRVVQHHLLPMLHDRL